MEEIKDSELTKKAVTLLEVERGYLVTVNNSLPSPTRVKFDYGTIGVGKPEIFPVTRKHLANSAVYFTLQERHLIEYGLTPQEAQKKAYEKALEYSKERGNFFKLPIIDKTLK